MVGKPTRGHESEYSMEVWPHRCSVREGEKATCHTVGLKHHKMLPYAGKTQNLLWVVKLANSGRLSQ